MRLGVCPEDVGAVKTFAAPKEVRMCHDTDVFAMCSANNR
jgi:hypothetical protein